MKLLLPIFLIGFFLTLQNEAFAIIHKNKDNPFLLDINAHRVSPKEAYQMSKPRLFQKYLSKIPSIKQDSIKKQNDLTEKSQGDKLANISYGCFLFAGILVLLGLLFLVLQVEIGGLILLGMLKPVLMVSVIIYILAITHKDITPKGKKRAKAGLYRICGLFLFLFLLFLVLALLGFQFN